MKGTNNLTTETALVTVTSVMAGWSRDSTSVVTGNTLTTYKSV
jgi:hypothetical protein